MRATYIANKFTKILLCAATLLAVATSCRHGATAGAPQGDSADLQTFDLTDIENAGELIAVTLSGPETYYTYRGQEMGLQYLLAEHFTKSLGLGLRMEIAHDTTELVNMLLQAKPDLIACPLPRKTIEKLRLIPAAPQGKGRKAWAVRPTSSQLASALITWWNPSLPDDIMKETALPTNEKVSPTPVIRSGYVPRVKGQLSPYDSHFKTYAAKAGLDWRLLAAIAWQESAFDPTARSWAGARGLMQIMPATGARLGLTPEQLNEPEASIRGASAYLKQLYADFSDIGSPMERIKFALAAYNGGPGHVRDAIRLAAKNKAPTQSWDRVAPFVLRLSEPRFYQDPVVRNGYMIGRETHDYVYAVMSHWRNFSGLAGGGLPATPDLHTTPERATKKNRFTRRDASLSPDDSVFQIN